MISKIINIVLAFLFLSFVIVQFNDPDPLLWITIYGNMAVLCAWSAFRTPNKYWVLLAAIGYFAYALFLFPGAIEWFKSPDRSLLFDDLAKMQYPYIEETRECLGLLVCVLVLVWMLWKQKLSNNKPAQA
ncbi:MAG: transmembrane 220 family protein [Cyclobacteriaceae bacterium]|nr:transmembrane 220 family protein [Cyclobacteriaceae bacterium]